MQRHRLFALLHKGFHFATEGGQLADKRAQQQQINGGHKSVRVCVVYGVYSCVKHVQMCVCVCFTSSIKEMFGHINHDIAHSLCGGRSVTCPRQLLFTVSAALQNAAPGFYGEFL